MVTRLKHFLARPKVQTRVKHSEFLMAWLRAPLKVASITPSSKSLARAMVRPVNLNVPGVVIELGAGTGPVTHALLESHVPSERLLVVERDPRLFGLLRGEFPDLSILRGDALELDKIAQQQGIERVCAIVSSLPLLSMPRAVRMGIENRMAAAIGQEGCIVQFTYGALSPIPKDRWRSLRIYGKRSRFVVSNVPPAYVWVYRRERRIKRRD